MDFNDFARMQLFMELLRMQQENAGEGVFFGAPPEEMGDLNDFVESLHRGQRFGDEYNDDEYDGSDSEEEEVEEDEEEDDDVALLEALDDLPIARLKKELADRGLSDSGSKEKLKSRLREHLESVIAAKRRERNKKRAKSTDDSNDESTSAYDEEDDYEEDDDYIDVSEMLGNPNAPRSGRAIFVDQEHWVGAWAEVAEYLRDDYYLYTLFNRSLQPQVTPKEAKKLNAKRIHDVLSELISTATQTDKPSIPEDLLASTKEKLEYLCKLAKEVPTLMKSCFDHSDFMDKYDFEDNGITDCPELFGSRLHAIRIGAWEPVPAWEGQFILRTNPITEALELEMCRFNPNAPPPALKKAIKKLGPTNTLTIEYIFNQLEGFEVSRLLRMSIPFSTISGIQYSSKGDYGLLVIDVNAPPKFFTRRINTVAFKNREWKERCDFTNSKQATTVRRYYFMSEERLLQPAVAMMMQCSPHLNSLIAKGIDLNVSSDPEFTAAEQQLAFSASTKVEPNKIVPGSIPSAFLQELVALGLISEETKDSEDALIPFGPCFKDFLMYRAESVEDVREALSSLFTETSKGVFDLDEYKGETVLHFLKYAKDNKLTNSGRYYSFCRRQLVSAEDDRHCEVCHLCLGHEYVHCTNCDLCAPPVVPRFCSECGCDRRNPTAKVKHQPLSRAAMQHHLDSTFFAGEYEMRARQGPEPVVSDESETDEPSWAL